MVESGQGAEESALEVEEIELGVVESALVVEVRQQGVVESR